MSNHFSVFSRARARREREQGECPPATRGGDSPYERPFHIPALGKDVVSLNFTTVWANHPTTKGENSPCQTADGTPTFENQCAIRLGIALADSGVNLSSFPGVRCWEKGHKNHTLRVEQLVTWLKAQTKVFGKPTVYKGKTPDNGEKALKELAGKTGIVAWLNFWGNGNQGDHIDLWDGYMIRKGSLDYFSRCGHILFWSVT
jgi:hypothetical protein